MLVAFVQFEFTRALGPDQGTYMVVGPAGSLPGLAVNSAENGDRLPTNVLMIAFVGEEDARRRVGRRRARRARRHSGPGELSIVRATFVGSSCPLESEREAERFLRRWRNEADLRRRWRRVCLATINRAIYGCRVATRDPYIVEARPCDARAVRYGWGEAERILMGRATEVLTEGPSTPGREEDTMRAREAIRADLAIGLPLLEAEELILSCLSDLEQRRPKAAAFSLRAGVVLALDEIPAGSAGRELVEITADETFSLADTAVRRPLTGEEEARVGEIAELVTRQLGEVHRVGGNGSRQVGYHRAADEERDQGHAPRLGAVPQLRDGLPRWKPGQPSR